MAVWHMAFVQARDRQELRGESEGGKRSTVMEWDRREGVGEGWDRGGGGMWTTE